MKKIKPKHLKITMSIQISLMILGIFIVLNDQIFIGNLLFIINFFFLVLTFKAFKKSQLEKQYTELYKELEQLKKESESPDFSEKVDAFIENFSRK